MDLQGPLPANVLDSNVFAYLLSLCATGKVRTVLLGPPCRTISALRYQQDGGPGVLRDDDHPYGRPDLSIGDQQLVENDVILWFRGLALYVLAEDVREMQGEPTQFVLEQPEDPARYRKPHDVEKYKYFSLFRTQEWRQFAERYEIHLLHFDQHPMGHKKRKPTTLATNMLELHQLDGLRGEQEDEQHTSEVFRAMTLSERMRESKTWACWAPGLKAAISTAITRHLRTLSVEVPQDPQPTLRPLNQVALEAWKQHFLHDHLPARRDCAHCVRAQGRSRPHRRVMHPDAFTLSVDLSGKMSIGTDQDGGRCRYIMVACYTFPVTGSGHPLIDPPGVSKEDKDHPLPSMDLHGRGGQDPQSDQPLPSVDLHGGGDRWADDEVFQDGVFGDEDDVVMDDGGDAPPVPEDHAGLADPPDPLQEQSHPEPGPDGLVETSMRTAFDVWHRLVEDAKDVGVRNLTFTEVIPSRAVKDVLPALARIYARLRYLGLPLHRLHCDRARELTSAPVRKWTLDRGVITTLTTGSSYKTNGRVENEVGAVKRAVRTLLSANLCPLAQWPLALRHIGERRLRSQLQSIGWPAAPLLKFGTRAFALKKSWQDRYCPWRDVREEVVVMGPDRNSSLTTTNYYVKSVSTGRFFYTDDVVQPTTLPDPVEPPGEPNVFLPERAAPAPAIVDGVPTRRLRGKTAIQAVRSMSDIEGEDWVKDGVKNGFGFNLHNLFQIPESLRIHFEMDEGSTASSWTLGTDSEQTSASSQAETPTMESDVEGFGGGEEEEAPNDRAGGAYPVASGMSGLAALRRLHCNVGEYIESEYEKLDATSTDQSMWIGALTGAIQMKAMLENQLQGAQALEAQRTMEQLDQEFLVTKTISNAEVWANLEAWQPSIKAEFDQLVNNKRAVRQITKSELQQLAQQKGLPIEVLPGKMVHTRKSGTGAYKSRAVVCGNYEAPDNAEHYAGGSDANQVRAMLRLGALQNWMCACTDIRTAFLNAPRRETNKLLAMEIPVVFRKLGLADSNQIWLIDKALYGLTSSPRDWGVHRDETVPKITWHRERFGCRVQGAFKKTPDENIWRIEEVNCETGAIAWSGLMSIYVDDLLFVAEEGVVDAATTAIEKTWAISAVEKTKDGATVKYCGFEIEAINDGGFKISQTKYEAEMLQRWNVTRSAEYPQFKTTEEDENPTELQDIDANQIKQAQAVAGALLWLSTRTRPDLSVGVATVCRLATRNPVRAVEIGMNLMEYVKGNPGGLLYPNGVPGNVWGEREQLKIARHPRLLEVMADIAFGTGTKHRSIQGIATFFGGCIISWNSSIQPFVTHSTAESELVAYCDALNVGRSTEAMLCAMLGEPSGTSSIERVIYGDNLAAIGLASGTGGTSWRTRHLRIRASYVKEALEGQAPGGVWRLIHLRGVDLVADGLTKPLLGQAFMSFVRDLGMQTRRDGVEGEGSGTNPQIAAVALAVGGMLLSGVDSEEIGDETEFGAVWACGATLMALGAIYAGQIAYGGIKSCTRFCLKRLYKTSHQQNEDGCQQSCVETTKDGTSVKVECSDSNPSRSSTSLSLKITSGSQNAAGSTSPLPSRGGEHSVSAAAGSTSPLPSRGGERSVFAAAGPRSPLPSRGGERSVFAAAGPRSPLPSRGGERAVLAAAGTSFSASCGGDPAAAASSSVGVSPTPKKEMDLTNPWNRFQHEHAGQGFTKQTLSKMYRYHKQKLK